MNQQVRISNEIIGLGRLMFDKTYETMITLQAEFEKMAHELGRNRKMRI